MERSRSSIHLGLIAILLAGCANVVAPEASLLDYPPNLSQYQLNILQDNIVTDSEYRQAIQDEADCVAQKGFQVTELFLADDGFRLNYGIEYQVSDRDSGQSARMAALDSCRNEYSNFIRRYYSRQQRPEGEERERIFQELIACLESYGITGITSGFERDEVTDAIWYAVGDDSDIGPWEAVMADCYLPRTVLFE